MTPNNNPNNNFSVLPFYESLAEQNARRWWIYGKVFPLYAPQSADFIPFQIARPHTGLPLVATATYADNILLADGTRQPAPASSHTEIKAYSTAGMSSVGFHTIPSAALVGGVMAVAFNSQSAVVGTFNPVQSGEYTGQWELPAGAVLIMVLTYVDDAEGEREGYAFGDTMKEIESIILYTADGVLVHDYDDGGDDPGIYYKRVSEDADVIVCSSFPVAAGFPIGQFYLRLSDGVNVWYSEIFTVIDDPSDCLLLEWANDEDFVMDAGTIVYTEPAFTNRLLLRAEIAKPEYIFEEEGESRDGYFFPVKQISEKRYRFSFLAPEYLLDVMRFVRMADTIRITAGGKTYRPDTFLITPEWESNGDIAGVQAEFDTDTVAKKLARGYNNT